jgi:hypothetical protein
MSEFNVFTTVYLQGVACRQNASGAQHRHRQRPQLKRKRCGYLATFRAKVDLRSLKLHRNALCGCGPLGAGTPLAVHGYFTGTRIRLFESSEAFVFFEKPAERGGDNVT